MKVLKHHNFTGNFIKVSFLSFIICQFKRTASKIWKCPYLLESEPSLNSYIVANSKRGLEFLAQVTWKYTGSLLCLNVEWKPRKWYDSSFDTIYVVPQLTASRRAHNIRRVLNYSDSLRILRNETSRQFSYIIFNIGMYILCKHTLNRFWKEENVH